jgi:catechol 2,3-dioxygenase-like lactoylglutathione lyase family enzyme
VRGAARKGGPYRDGPGLQNPNLNFESVKGEANMLKPTGLTEGHYECRSYAETIPILTDTLALEVVRSTDNEKALKHPNTEWELVLHEGRPDAPNKPLRNHYGVRVTTNEEVDRACEYLESKKEALRIKVIKPRENHNAYSVHFFEPGGNFWEIESYEKAVESHMGKTTNPHWTTPLAREKFSGKGYVPQALTHGTLENDDLEGSERFYREILGLDVVKLWPSSCYLKHRSTPWYVVCIQAQSQNRQRLTRYQRFTLAVESTDAVRAAHQSFETHRREWKINELDPIKETPDRVSFLFSDLDSNWWEIAATVTQPQAV